MRLVFAAALTVALATPAHAGWQWTNWGMSLEEVLATMPDDIEGVGGRNAWIVELTASGFEFQAQLDYGEADSLVAVLLLPKLGMSCDAIGKALVASYRDQPSSGLFRDTANQNLVEFQYSSDRACLLTYRPLPAPGAPGSL